MNAERSDDSRETVVLLHGVALNRWFMSRIARHLERAGYRTENISHPSRRLPIDTLAAEWLPSRLAGCGLERAPRVHFVAHSMGTLLVRHLLAHACPANLGRVVLIAPPNLGARLADEGRPRWLFKLAVGRNLHALGLSEDAFWRTLPQRVDYPVGIIAGTAPIGPYGLLSRERGDGTVNVESTHLAGSTDEIEMPSAHTTILFRKRTCAQVTQFLREGRFNR